MHVKANNIFIRNFLRLRRKRQTELYIRVSMMVVSERCSISEQYDHLP